MRRRTFTRNTMNQPPNTSLYNTDPTLVSRLDLPVGTVIEYTGKNVEEVFGVNHDGTRDPHTNKVYYDPDGVGLLVEIGAADANIQRFLSYFFRGILPMAEIVAHASHDGEDSDMRYYSLAFEPERIEATSTEAERYAGSHLLEAFGDEDHDYVPSDDIIYNIAIKGEKHYFYDFQVNSFPLKEFPQAQIPYGGYGFMRKDVREAFYRMVRELYARYDQNDGIAHFFAIGKKS